MLALTALAVVHQAMSEVKIPLGDAPLALASTSTSSALPALPAAVLARPSSVDAEHARSLRWITELEGSLVRPMLRTVASSC